MFPRDFAIPQEGKSKSIFEFEGQKVANCGCVPRWLLGASLGLFGECWRASALIVHQHSKIAALGLFGAIAFPRCSQISVLRAFLGGLFGFIGFACGFGCLVAFVALVGLYACSVRRLKSEKRKPAHFFRFRSFGFLYRCCFACLVCFAPVLCWLWLCCWLSFPIGQNEKKSAFILRSVFTWYWCLYFKLSNAIIASL